MHSLSLHLDRDFIWWFFHPQEKNGCLTNYKIKEDLVLNYNFSHSSSTFFKPITRFNRHISSFQFAWLTISLTGNVPLILIATCVAGVGIAGQNVAIIYISEIAHDSIRGGLTASSASGYFLGKCLKIFAIACGFHRARVGKLIGKGCLYSLSLSNKPVLLRDNVVSHRWFFILGMGSLVQKIIFQLTKFIYEW